MFRSVLPGGTRNNAFWIWGKFNVVQRFETSSLDVAYEAAEIGHDRWLQKYGLSTRGYKPVGGGIPVFVGDQMCFVVLFSGLPHEQDHEFLADNMAISLEEARINFGEMT